MDATASTWLQGCSAALAEALCAELRALTSVVPVAAPDAADFERIGARLMEPELFRPVLRRSAAVLHREFGCEQTPAPPLQGKAVENGKSAMGFMVPGGDGVSVDDPGSFSVLLKELNAEEVASLPALLPPMLQHYGGAEGTLLARHIGWVRCTAPSASGTGKPVRFDAILSENAARTPPGAWDVVSRWKPFDMKGLRLYAHEKRYAASYGERGLQVSAAHFERLQRALRRDVGFLTSRELVDYSYLLSVFPTDAPPAPCAAVRARADYHAGDFDGRAASAVAAGWREAATPLLGDPPPAGELPRLVPAVYQLQPAEAAAAAAEDGEEGDDGDEEEGGGALCAGVVVRVALIDYLRGWRLTEQMEHLRKSLTRDIFAGERNHAVVPVADFGRQFEAFFGSALFAPVAPQRPAVAWARLLSDGRRAVRGAAPAARSAWSAGVPAVRGAWSTAAPRVAEFWRGAVGGASGLVDGVRARLEKDDEDDEEEEEEEEEEVEEVDEEDLDEVD